MSVPGVMRPMIALLLTLAVSGAGASRAGATAPVEAGTLETVVIMRVDATIVIDPNGELAELKIDTPLIPELRSTLDKAVRRWRFRPVLIDGAPRRASTALRIVLAATREGDHFRVKIDSVSFPESVDAKAVKVDGALPPITGKQLNPPRYPREQQAKGVMGTILLGIRITPEGRVGDITAIQSMLYENKHDEKANRRSIRAFEAAAFAVASRWTFNVPAGSASRGPDGMTVTVPVQYNLGYQLEAPGQWLTVLRLPKRPLPWLPAATNAAELGVADVTGGSVSPLASAFKLSSDVAGTPLL